MKTFSRLNQLLCAALILFGGARTTLAQVPQLLNYQGRIAVNGTNFTGTGQFKFALVDGGANVTRAASGTATVYYGFLVAVNITDGGSGYSSPPTVLVNNGGGSGASCTAQISGGMVTNVIVNNPGGGYFGSTTILFSAPAASLVAQTFWSNDGSSSSGGQPITSVPLPVTRGLYSVLLGDTTLSNMSALPASVFANSDVRLRVWFNDGITGYQQLTPDQRLAAVGYAITAGSAQTVPDGSITASKIATGAVGSSQLAPSLTLGGTLTVSNLVVNGSALNGDLHYQFPTGPGISFQTYAGGDYFMDGSINNISLPANANVGDVVRLYFPQYNSGPGLSSSYRLLQNPGQRIVGWRGLNPQNAFSAPIMASADATRVMVNLGTQGFLISTNAGLSWGVQPPSMTWIPQGSYRTFSIAGDGLHIYVDVDGRLLSSKDGGQSWGQKINFDQQFGSPISITCSSNGNSVAMISGTGIYLSIDSGSNWTQQATVSGQSIASSADGSKLLAAAGYGIYVSSNSGQGWVPQTTGIPNSTYFYGVASSADGGKFIAAASAGIFISTNSGLNWNVVTGVPAGTPFQAAASSADGSVLAAVAASAVYISDDSGYSWYPRLNGTNLSSVTISADGTKLYAVGLQGVYFSTDQGNTWNVSSTVPNNTFLTPYTISNIGPDGGATFSPNWGWDLILVYVGNGMFTQKLVNGASIMLNGY